MLNLIDLLYLELQNIYFRLSSAFDRITRIPSPSNLLIDAEMANERRRKSIRSRRVSRLKLIVFVALLLAETVIIAYVEDLTWLTNLVYLTMVLTTTVLCISCAKAVTEEVPAGKFALI